MSLLPGWLTCAKKRSAAKSQMKILPLREREVLKQLKKDPSATVVASVRPTGATVVGSVNATEFWQRRTRSPSFLLLLSRKMELAIPQWSTLRPGRQMIYYNYRFCDNYFRTCFLHWRAVFGKKKPLTKLRLFHGCSDKSRWRKQKKKKKKKKRRSNNCGKNDN